MEKDILILVLRLLGEDPDTFSPEVAEVMEWWQEKAHAVLRGEHVYENDKYYDFYNSVTCLIAEGSEFMPKAELYDAIKREHRKV